jgi:hypothetical protein
MATSGRSRTMGCLCKCDSTVLLDQWISEERHGSSQVQCEKSLMTSKAWLAEVDARLDYDYSTERVTWSGACAVVLVDQEVVCSPVVLRDLGSSVDTLWEAPGKTSATSVGVEAAISFCSFGSFWGVSS